MTSNDPAAPWLDPNSDAPSVDDPPPVAPSATDPVNPASADPIRPRTLTRSRTDSVVGGVCGGLGAAAGIDPVWFRLGFIFLALSWGSGFLIYVAAWILLPEAPDIEPPATAGPARNNAAAIFGMILVTAGIALLISIAVPWFDRVVWPLAVIGVGAALLYFGSDAHRNDGG